MLSSPKREKVITAAQFRRPDLEQEREQAAWILYLEQVRHHSNPPGNPHLGASLAWL